MKKRMFLFFVLFFSSITCFASETCLIFYDLKGNLQIDGKNKKNNFSKEEDKFILKANNEILHLNNKIPEMKYIMLNNGTILGLYSLNGNKVVETWTMEKSTQKVYFHRTKIWSNDKFSSIGSYIGKMKDC